MIKSLVLILQRDAQDTWEGFQVKINEEIIQQADAGFLFVMMAALAPQTGQQSCVVALTFGKVKP